MGKIFCLMGKSASGKDFVYKNLIAREDLQLKQIVPYTTRPIRNGEVEGLTYFFRTDAEAEEMERAGKVIEMRAYNTVHGVWKYFTADDGQVDLTSQDYLMIGTPESCVKIREYFGTDAVCPIYIWVDDGERLARALKRERKQEQPKYAEMCRRFLADERDFSEENLRKAGVDISLEYPQDAEKGDLSGGAEELSGSGCFENREKEQILADVAEYIVRMRGNETVVSA